MTPGSQQKAFHYGVLCLPVRALACAKLELGIGWEDWGRAPKSLCPDTCGQDSCTRLPAGGFPAALAFRRGEDFFPPGPPMVVPRRCIMPPTGPSASKGVVTAALLVIGGKILSGRTKDQNIGYVAEYLTAVGIDLNEVRVVGDEERAIVDALNALRHRYTYVFTTGGIGPTHSDITADCVAKAFGVPIEGDPRALAILHEWVKNTGAEMNEARLRLTRIPKGANLILNKVSGAPGFWIGNVIVMAGVPSIMQAMLDEVAP